MEERFKTRLNYRAHESFSFHRYKLSQQAEFNRSLQINYRNESEKQWDNQFQDVKAANGIMRMDMLIMRERVKPMNN